MIAIAPTEGRDAVLTYRYLRITMVAVLLMLGFSVLYQRWGEGCELGSVSAYYFTPVRSVFVGALFVFGAALIAYHSSRPEEEALLNLSGFTSIVVALVPTTSNGCKPTGGPPAVTNNIYSLGFATAIAIGLAFWINRIAKRPVTKAVRPNKTSARGPDRLSRQAENGKRSWRGRGLAAFRSWWSNHGSAWLVWACRVAPVAGFVYFLFWRDQFIAEAHKIAAIIMVVGLIFYMFFNATLADHPMERILKVPYEWIYRFLAGALLIVLVLIWIFSATTGFGFQIYLLEFIIIGVFVVYWLVQSVELRGRTN